MVFNVVYKSKIKFTGLIVCQSTKLIHINAHIFDIKTSHAGVHMKMAPKMESEMLLGAVIQCILPAILSTLAAAYT